MSLSLKESCRLYEQHCRRDLKVPTFEEFNGQHATCLPSNPAVYKEFKRVLTSAHKADGVPVTRRLVNLWSRLSKSPSKSIAISPPSLQVPVPPAPASMIPDPSLALKMKIRPPGHCPVLTKKKQTWSLSDYKETIHNSSSQKLKESSGLMVHLVPPSPVEDLTSLACKLTKSNWNALLGKDNTAKLLMRDGSEFALSGVKLNKNDLFLFKQEHKKKQKGPYFVRFSPI